MVSKWWTGRIPGNRAAGRGINGKFTANQIGGVFCKFSAI
jgi:hypothetical protein